jgi:hypothetical protein
MVFTKVRASNNLRVIKMDIPIFLNYLNTMVISEMASFGFRTMVPNSKNSPGNLWVSVPPNNTAHDLLGNSLAKQIRIY